MSSISWVLNVTCPDVSGLVAAVTGFLAERGAFITSCAHHTEHETGQAYVRVAYEMPANIRLGSFDSDFAGVARRFSLDYQLYKTDKPMKVLIAVSKFGHCLQDLLHRWRAGILPIDVVGVVSNHPDMREFVEWHDLPYYHRPISRDTKADQEAAFRDVIERSGAELTVLARYMQILSDSFCRYLDGRAINIHHSFLPSFKGARPYSQAYERGVKIIGATAHYVTSDLDEGPIIEQDVARVDHRLSPQEMVNLGRDIESVVLARAVKWHAERRIVAHGNRTLVF